MFFSKNLSGGNNQQADTSTVMVGRGHSIGKTSSPLFEDEEKQKQFNHEVESLIKKQLDLVQNEGEKLIHESSPHPGIEKNLLLMSRSHLISQKNFNGTGDYNTGTIHLQVITHINNTLSGDEPHSVKNKISRCAASFSSLACVCAQFIVLYFLIIESSFPVCSMHSDCDIGKYCEPSVSRSTVPRCTDCSGSALNNNILPWGKENNNCTDDYYQELNEDDVIVWVSGDKVFHPDINQTTIECLAMLHCLHSNINYELGAEIDTGSMYATCDFLELINTKVTWTVFWILIFTSLIFGTFSYNDIRECIIEERVLNYVIEKQDDDATLKNPFTSCGLMFFSLRMRRFVMPWWVAGATTTIVATSTISAKEVLLNLAAVTFITEVDNYMAKFFLNDAHLSVAKQLATDVERSKDRIDPASLGSTNAHFNYWQPRILTLLPMAFMVVAVTNPQTVIDVVNPPYLRHCNGFSVAIGFMSLFYCHYPTMSFDTLSSVFFGEIDDTFQSKQISMTYELSRNNMMMYFSGCLWANAGIVIFTYLNAFGVIIALSMVIHLGFHYASFRLRSSKSTKVNSLFTLTYICVNILVFIYNFVLLWPNFMFPEWYARYWFPQFYS